MRFSNRIALLAALLVVIAACSSPSPTPTDEDTGAQDTTSSADAEDAVESDSDSHSDDTSETQTGEHADVTGVDITGDPGSYRFSVTVDSPDTGCDQYANWWEVVSEDGELLYRRILAHSHVDEQPFTRSGGPVDIDGDTTVYVRAHMNTTGYGGQAAQISPNGELEWVELDAGFAPGIESAAPQPDGCAF